MIIAASDWPTTLQSRADQAVCLTLQQCDCMLTGPAEVSVLLTDDAAQAKLNQQWRGHNKSTNVLSFPALEPSSDIAGLIGDISLAYETVAREATTQHKSFDDHFTHLLIHGLLHCLGYDHVDAAAAKKMEALETRILSLLDIGDPYDDAYLLSENQ